MEHKLVFQYPTISDHYTADAFVIRCFDNRFWKTFKRFIKDAGLTHIDVESVAGGAKVIASPEKISDRDFMLRELKKSIRLHHTSKVMIFTHQDCGAYGSNAKFGNLDKEIAFHRREHARAKKLINSLFPNLPVESYFLTFEGVTRI